MSYNANQNSPVRQGRPSMVGTPPQTHYQRPPMPPVVQQYPQHPQQRPYSGPPQQVYRPMPGQHPHPVVQQQVVVQQKKGVNHAFHLIMSLITFGLWIPVWVLCAIFD